MVLMRSTSDSSPCSPQLLIIKIRSTTTQHPEQVLSDSLLNLQLTLLFERLLIAYHRSRAILSHLWFPSTALRQDFSSFKDIIFFPPTNCCVVYQRQNNSLAFLSYSLFCHFFFYSLLYFLAHKEELNGFEPQNLGRLSSRSSRRKMQKKKNIYIYINTAISTKEWAWQTT